MDELEPETLIRLRLIPADLECAGEGCEGNPLVAAYMTEDGEVFGLCQAHHYFTNPNLTIIDEFEAQRGGNHG